MDGRGKEEMKETEKVCEEGGRDKSEREGWEVKKI